MHIIQKCQSSGEKGWFCRDRLFSFEKAFEIAKNYFSNFVFVQVNVIGKMREVNGSLRYYNESKR